MKKYHYIINTPSHHDANRLVELARGTRRAAYKHTLRRDLAKLFNVKQAYIVIVRAHKDAPISMPTARDIQDFCAHAMLENVPAASLPTGEWLHANAHRIAMTINDGTPTL